VSQQEFMDALESYIRKCKELADSQNEEQNEQDDNETFGEEKETKKADGAVENERREEEENLSKMVKKFSTLLQGFAFQQATFSQ
jgi:hypothetical protein